MKTATTMTLAERLGRSVGRMWRGIVRWEGQIISELVRRGLPSRAGWWLCFSGKLSLILILFLLAFWIAVVLLFFIGFVWCTNRVDWNEEPEPEWRDGLSGFGLYRGDIRIDIGDPLEDS